MTGIVQALLAGYGAVSAAVSDAYFNLVTLLLPGNGTNGAQNNTFLDSSTNNFTITRNGNTTQGTFSPFSQTGWGNYFDGSGDYLSCTPTAIGTGNFTVEFFFFCTVNNSFYRCLFDTSGSNYDTAGSLRISTGPSNNTLQVATANTGLINASSSFTINAWNHVALVRNGTTLTLYLNGVSVGSTTNSTNFSTNDLRIGLDDGVGGPYGFTGYISNFRMVVGSAVYTAAFTPPTAPLTAITNTSLLTCQSNRFIDNSSNAFAITANGDVSVQAFSPFAPTAAYSAATNGGSGYFDGNTEYLRAGGTVGIANNAFTICLWFYPLTSSVVGLFDSGSGQTNVFRNNPANTIEDQNTSPSVSFAGSYQVRAWNWMCITKSGTSFTVYVNGSSVGTGTCSNPLTETAFDVGGYNSGSESFNGYISDFQVLNTATVVAVPTAPRTAVSGTTYLLNFTNAGITDATSKNVLETVGNAQISTTQSKFGGSSMYFDGTGDYLSFPSNQNLVLGTGDFTIEFWLYFNAVNNSTIKFIYDFRNASATSSSFLAQESTNAWTYWNGAGSTLSTGWTSGTFTTSTWYHIAICRSSGTTKFFVDGTSTSSVADTSNYANGTFIMASRYNGQDYLNAYIDDLRITKGYARYTANFTAPASAFPLQ